MGRGEERKGKRRGECKGEERRRKEKKGEGDENIEGRKEKNMNEE